MVTEIELFKMYKCKSVFSNREDKLPRFLYFYFNERFNWQICYTRRNNRFVAVHNKWSKIPPPLTSIHFANYVRRWSVVWFDLHFSLDWQQHPKCDRAVRLVRPPFFLKLRSSTNPTNKNLKSSGMENPMVLSRWPLRIRLTFYWHFLKWPIDHWWYYWTFPELYMIYRMVYINKIC
jgi:hypothetical protein